MKRLILILILLMIGCKRDEDCQYNVKLIFTGKVHMPVLIHSYNCTNPKHKGK